MSGLCVGPFGRCHHLPTPDYCYYGFRVKTSFSANLARLLFGKVTVQVLVVVTTPILTRLFLPQHFGSVQLFDSIVALFVVIKCLNYEYAIPLAKDPREASAMFLLGLGISIVIALGGLAGVLTGRTLLASWLNTPELASLLWFLPMFIVINGLIDVCLYWGSREGTFGILALATVGNLAGERIISIAMGSIAGASTLNLFLGRLAGILVQGAILWGGMRREVMNQIHQTSPSFRLIRRIAIQQKKFPLYNMWVSLLNILSIQMLLFIFGIYFSPDILGYYSLANRVGTMPVTLFGQTIAQILFPAAAKALRETGTFSLLIKNVFLRLLQIGIFPLLVLGLFGATLFQFFFGQQWTEAGVYAQIMAGWYFMSLLTAPFPIFTLTDHQEINLLINVISLGAQVISLLIGVRIGIPRISITLFVICNVLLLAVQLAWKLRLAQVSLLWAAGGMLKYGSLACALLLPVKLLSLTLRSNPSLDIILLFFAAIGYVAVLLLLEPSLWEFAVKQIQIRRFFLD
jgi:lipopolysaccharide exporter